MHSLIHSVVHSVLLLFPHLYPQSIVDSVEGALTTAFAHRVTLTCIDAPYVLSLTVRVAADLASTTGGTHIPDSRLDVVVHNVLHTVHGWSRTT